MSKEKHSKKPGVMENLPTWEECEQEVLNGTATALQVFIHENEPAGARGEQVFRIQLANVMKELVG